MYVFNNTERNNFKASTFETKSLLYLIGLRPDRKEISVLAIDCFNDVTGMNSSSSKLWDVQSKGEANLTPYKIGKYLFTLYDNYDSKFKFHDYIFFMPALKNEYLNEDITYIYKTCDFKEKQKEKIKSGLTKELDRLSRNYSESYINDFLEQVIYVEDRKNTSTYVKKVLDFKSSNQKDNIFYDEIFKEIRDLQTAKKNTYIEGREITTPLEVLKFDRHIRTSDIHMLIVNRFVGVDLFNQKMIPISFIGEASGLDTEDLADLIQDCQSNISRAFFSKNSKHEFWRVFDKIISALNDSPSLTIRDIYKIIDYSILSKLSLLDENSVLFLTALIKDGLTSEN